MAPAKPKSNHRVTIEEVKAAIKKTTYTVLPSGRTTVCELTLTNGLTVLGTSTVLDIKNFNAKLGKAAAYTNAENNVWEILGVIKQQIKFDTDKATATAGKIVSAYKGTAKRAIKAGEVLTSNDVTDTKVDRKPVTRAKRLTQHMPAKKAAKVVKPKAARKPLPKKAVKTDDGSWPFPNGKTAALGGTI